jgi:hypothetical protein
MEYWELAEYIFAGLVTLGCLGEFAGEFTDWELVYLVRNRYVKYVNGQYFWCRLSWLRA